MANADHAALPFNFARLVRGLRSFFYILFHAPRPFQPRRIEEAGIYFVTLHLADALPSSVHQKIAERRLLLETCGQNRADLPAEQKELLAGFSQARIEEQMDCGLGSCPFLDQRVAGAMAAALRFQDQKRYRLLAWCIMPNHVHVVLQLYSGPRLANVVNAWKTRGLKASNHAIGRKKRFWKQEVYIHRICGENELHRAVRYVVENPVKAGLTNWIWVWNAGKQFCTRAIQHPDFIRV